MPRGKLLAMPSDGPLEGVFVLDLSRLLPGGYCTLLLADLGADVVKVEEPGRGDYIRATPPLVNGASAAHRALNRCKRSVTLNLKDPEGADILRRLAARADVLVESFRPGVMERWGVGHRELASVNPELVYAAITGYGQDGPYRDIVGHDINYVGYGGVISMTGQPDGPPVVPGVQIGDLGGATLAAVGILAALVDRPRTGRGRFVDASMLDGVISWLSVHAGAFLSTGDTPARGTAPLGGGYACYRVYRTKDDRYLTVGALEPRFWEALCRALGAEDLVDHQYGSPDQQARMAERLQAVFVTKTRDEWMTELGDVPGCVGPVNDLAEALADPQVRHRGMVAEVEGEAVGPGPVPRVGTRERPPLRPAPGLGEHTAEVLGLIGLGPEVIDRLRARGVV